MFVEKNTSTSGMRVRSGSVIRTADNVGASGSVRKTASLNRGSVSIAAKVGTSGVNDGELSLLCAVSI